jgi:hypothetical protein
MANLNAEKQRLGVFHVVGATTHLRGSVFIHRITHASVIHLLAQGKLLVHLSMRIRRDHEMQSDPTLARSAHL